MRQEVPVPLVTDYILILLHSSNIITYSFQNQPHRIDSQEENDENPWRMITVDSTCKKYCNIENQFLKYITQPDS